MFDVLFSFLDSAVLQNISQMVGIFANVITPLIGSCVALYALYLAYQSLYDAENMMIMESMKTIGSLALCTTIAFSTTWYLSSIVPMILYIGDDIASALLGSSGTGAIQSMYDDTTSTIQTIWSSIDISVTDGNSWSEAALKWVLCVLTLLGALPFIGIATAYLVVAKVMVGFLLIIGPLFIMLAFFPTSRSMFQSWTGQCFNYILLSILYPIAFSMFNATLDTVMTTKSINLNTALMTFLLFFVFIVLSVQIPVLSSSLSGGVGINGLVSNMGAGVKTAGGFAKSAGKYSGANAARRFIGKKAKAGAKSAWDKMKNNIKPG